MPLIFHPHQQLTVKRASHKFYLNLPRINSIQIYTWDLTGYYRNREARRRRAARQGGAEERGGIENSKTRQIDNFVFFSSGGINVPS